MMYHTYPIFLILVVISIRWKKYKPIWKTNPYEKHIFLRDKLWKTISQKKLKINFEKQNHMENIDQTKLEGQNTSFIFSN